MNVVERVLNEELTYLMDRLATTVPSGAFERIRTTNPTLKTRLDEMDTTLANIRGSLVETYGQWARALEDVENLWALAAWRSAAAEEPVEKSAALAA